MLAGIKKINIHAFRGIRELELDLNGRNLLLKGENGTGKSSIIDGIEFFFTGKVSHLVGTQSLSLQQHAPHVEFKPKDVTVEIIFNPGTISLSRSFNSTYEIPNALIEYFELARTGTFLLHRSQILEFIMNKPADRFRSLGNIIGISSLDNTELEMMRVKDELSGKLESKQKQGQELLCEISKLLNKDIKDIKNIIPMVNEILKKYNLPLIKSLDEINAIIEKMLKTTRETGKLSNFELLRDLTLKTKSPFISQEICNKIENISKNVYGILKDNKQEQISFLELLNVGKILIESKKIDNCPLCEQIIDQTILLKRLNERLKTLSALSDETSNLRKLSAEVADSMKRILQNIKDSLSKVEKFSEFNDEKKELKNYYNFLNEFINIIRISSEVKGKIEFYNFKKQVDQLDKIRQKLFKKSNELIEKIDITTKEKEFLKDVTLIGQIKGKLQDISKINTELEIYKKYLKYAEKIYNYFSECKKNKIQEIYSLIGGDIQSFYSKIHPNEPHNNLKLVLLQGRRASTEIKIDSFGRTAEDPRGLTSEGHLDSLGLCIFLAFVKNFNKDCSLIVLDDIVSTIDSRHRENICKLLIEDFNDKQLIITTHDALWYEQIQAFQRSYGLEGNFVNLVITNWDLNYGPKIKPYKPRWEKIQNKISDGDKTGAGNEGRQYLEWLLEKICELTEAHVPFKSSCKYEVRDLLNPAKKRLESLIKDPKFKEKTIQLFKELESTIILGNILSHNNPLAEQVSIDEIKRFCNNVHKIYEHLSCPNCKHLIKYFRELKIIRCPNKKCKSQFELKSK